MGQGRHKGGDKEAGGKNRPAKHWECGAAAWDARPPEWPTSPPEWRPRGKTEIWVRTKAARRNTAKQARRGRDQEHRDQVSSDGKGGEHCTRGPGKEGSNNTIEEWSGAKSEESEVSATEEEATTVGGLG